MISYAKTLVDFACVFSFCFCSNLSCLHNNYASNLSEEISYLITCMIHFLIGPKRQKYSRLNIACVYIDKGEIIIESCGWNQTVICYEE